MRRRCKTRHKVTQHIRAGRVRGARSEAGCAVRHTGIKVLQRCHGLQVAWVLPILKALGVRNAIQAVDKGVLRGNLLVTAPPVCVVQQWVRGHDRDGQATTHSSMNVYRGSRLMLMFGDQQSASVVVHQSQCACFAFVVGGSRINLIAALLLTKSKVWQVVGMVFTCHDVHTHKPSQPCE